MTAGLLQGLVWTSGEGVTLDLLDIPGGFWFTIAAGLSDVPPSRSSSDVIPFLAGRLRRPPVADDRPVLVEGRVLPRTEDDLPALLRILRRAMDPFRPVEGTLTATLEDGAVRTIRGVVTSVLPGDADRLSPRMSIELDADPYWRGPVWGAAWMSDMGLMSDDGLWSDMATGPITLTPAGVTPYSATFVTLGTTATLDAVVEVDGPSAGAIAVYAADGVGFAYPALSGGQTLIVDAGARTATIGGVSVRGNLTLRTANTHGAFFRVRPGSDTFTVTGAPAAVRVIHQPTYL